MWRYLPRTRNTGERQEFTRLLAGFVFWLVVCAVLSGCGAWRVQGALDAGFETVDGTVSSVQVLTTGANGTGITVTIVTLQQTLGFTTTSFCGNVSTQFPMHSFVHVNFTPGQPCSTLVVIVIG